MSNIISVGALQKIALVFLYITNPIAFASDEADFLAPYITFEDGKLVTIDPAKDLLAEAETALPTSTHSTTSSIDNINEVQTLGKPEMWSMINITIAASVFILVFTALGFYRARSK